MWELETDPPPSPPGTSGPDEGMMETLTPKQQQVLDLWMSCGLTPEYYAFVEAQTDDKTSFKDMSDELADKWIAILTEYRERHT